MLARFLKPESGLISFQRSWISRMGPPKNSNAPLWKTSFWKPFQRMCTVRFNYYRFPIFLLLLFTVFYEASRPTSSFPPDCRDIPSKLKLTWRHTLLGSLGRWRSFVLSSFTTTSRLHLPLQNAHASQKLVGEWAKHYNTSTLLGISQ